MFYRRTTVKHLLIVSIYNIIVLMELKRYPKSYQDSAIYFLVSLLLAAKNVQEALKIIDSFFGNEEKLALRRRVEIAENLEQGKGLRDVAELLKSSTKTVGEVYRRLFEFPDGFEIVLKKDEKIRKDYLNKKYIKVGGSKTVFKRSEKTDFKYKDLKR